MKKRGSLYVVALLLVSVILFGCADKNNTTTVNSTGNSAAQATSTMKGTVQGYLLDAVTQKPIVGAVIDIGIAQATTTSDGQYVLRDIPANQSSILTNPLIDGTGQEIKTAYIQNYFVTINMKGVTSPVAMGNTSATPRYPDYKFDTLTVKYETIANIVSAGTGSTGGTYVINTSDVTNHEFFVGKLAANISGVVGGCAGSPSFYTPVGAGYTVRLVTSGGSDNSTSGTGGNVVSTTTTDANGAFAFNNVEAGEDFFICASDAAHAADGCADGNAGLAGDQPFTMPADGQTLVLAIQESTAVHVCSTDVHGPAIVSVTPEDGADLTPGAVDVVFTFSEPIAQTAYTQRLTAASVYGGAAGLYNDVQVNYGGIKAGNIAHTLSWNSTFDQLTIAIPTTATSSIYTVDIHLADLIDASGLCVDTDGSTVCDNAEAAIAGANSITFTTNGGAVAAAPTIALTNGAQMDNTGAPNFDWLPVSGAKSYNVFRRMNQVWGTTINSHGYELVYTGVVLSEQADGVLNFVEQTGGDAIKLTYDYYVTSVNSDGTESAASNVANVSDQTAPDFAIVPTASNADGVGEIAVIFNEPMDEQSAEATSAYVLTRSAAPAVPVIATAVYDPTTWTVTLTYNGPLTIDTFNTLTITGVKDVGGNNNAVTPAGANVRTF